MCGGPAAEGAVEASHPVIRLSRVLVNNDIIISSFIIISYYIILYHIYMYEIFIILFNVSSLYSIWSSGNVLTRTACFCSRMRAPQNAISIFLANQKNSISRSPRSRSSEPAKQASKQATKRRNIFIYPFEIFLFIHSKYLYLSIRRACMTVFRKYVPHILYRTHIQLLLNMCASRYFFHILTSTYFRTTVDSELHACARPMRGPQAAPALYVTAAAAATPVLLYCIPCILTAYCINCIARPGLGAELEKPWKGSKSKPRMA